MNRQELMNKVTSFKRLGLNDSICGIYYLYIVPLKNYHAGFQWFNVIVFDGYDYIYVDDNFYSIDFVDVSLLEFRLPDTATAYKFYAPVKIYRSMENGGTLVISNRLVGRYNDKKKP